MGIDSLLTVGIGSLLPVPRYSVQLYSFESLPSEIILYQLIGEGLPLLVFFQGEEVTLLLPSYVRDDYILLLF